ncbi:MAG: diaminopimelate epimerase [Elusimicrobiota bacterium]
MRKIPFTKMSGAGNDFILIDAARLPRAASRPALARALCERRSSIGADGLLIVERRPRTGKGLPRVRYFNADGSPAFCANGSRCAAWWMHKSRWVGRDLRFDSSEGPVQALIAGAGRVRLRMPPARGPRRGLRLKAAGRTYRVEAINTGVPHAVVRVAPGRLDAFPVREVGRALRRHPVFRPGGTNVDFVSAHRGRCAIRTYERGVEDETLACGTGAVAAAILTAAAGVTKRAVRVVTRGGAVLTVRFATLPDGSFEDIWLEGPARAVYDGSVDL